MLDSQCLDSNISNLIELHHLSENAVLHILRSRFNTGYIYTFVSSILVAVNPFQEMSIYGQDYVDKYKNSSSKKSLPPHIFASADNAYVSLIRNYTSQSIVISGESGAGKTESIKLMLKYIAHASRHRNEKSGSIQDQILQANPLMEAFGNAKTSRNNNRYSTFLLWRNEYSTWLPFLSLSGAALASESWSLLGSVGEPSTKLESSGTGWRYVKTLYLYH